LELLTFAPLPRRESDVESIAIIGIGCRLPGANNPEAFWQLLQNGVDAITEVPKDRWNIDQFYDPEPGAPGKMSTRWGGFLQQVDQFDASFFGISPREVERMDPQQRLVLEVAWETLEQAGIAPDKLSGSQTGVFVGIGNYDYCRLLSKDISQTNAYDGTGNTLSIAANRLSYILNLRGPSVVIETACSSSLVALHFACRSLQSGESDMCLVGGVSLMLSPGPFITYSHARMMSPDGRCKTFDASADGYVRGEGCGFVAIKRLSDARRDGDTVLAIVKGTAVNQDGLSNGLTAPNGPSQQIVIRQALKNAGVDPTEISYVEAHGTGTALGDPIEFKALKAVLMPDRQPDQPCWLGSLKTNIGHLEAAAGITSVIKTVLSLQHREIPPHLHLKQLNPYISLEGTTFVIPTERQPWNPGTESRLAGISGFGFGGTNCHVILEEAPIIKTQPDDLRSDIDRALHLLTLSAKSEQALKDLAQCYVSYTHTHPEGSLADLCYTANTGRSHFEHRLAIVAASTTQLHQQLAAFTAEQDSTSAIVGHVSNKKRPKIAFLFTGQGSQYVGMGRQLYETHPLFRETIDRCNEILSPYLNQSLLEVLYPETTDQVDSAALLNETAYTQPALFALEYALFQVWKSWEIEPSIVMGHSVGEYVAACVAGVFSLEDGLKLIAARARLMQALPPTGEMVSVFADERTVQAVIDSLNDVAIAAINGPQSTVISGDREAIETAVAALKKDGIKAKKLSVSHAFHSPLMEPMLAEFERVAAEVNFSTPRLKLISNVTGAIATDEITTPAYWCRHVRQPVRFAQSINTLHQQGYQIFVELGPKPTLSGMGRYCLPEDAATWLPSLYPGREDWQPLLQSLSALYVRGVSVNWSAFDQPYIRHRLSLPTYPFQRQRYWADIPANGRVASSATPELTPLINLLNRGETQQLAQQLEAAESLSDEELKLLPKLLDLLVQQNQQQRSTSSIKEAFQDWLYTIEWQLKPRQVATPSQKNGFHQPGSWLILADQGGIGETIAHQLRDRHHHCIVVYPGETYQAIGNDTWRLNPANSGDFEQLFQDAFKTGDRPLKGILHLWSLAAAGSDSLTDSTLEQAQLLSVASTLHLLQSVVKHSRTDAPAGSSISSSKNGTNGSSPHTSTSSPRLWLVTRNAMPVADSSISIAQTPLWGLGRVIALEHPELWGGLLDLAPTSHEDEIADLLTEISESQGDDQLAFRDGQRYVARLVQQQYPNTQGISVRSNATYLITGGLGALGLAIAQWMVKQGARYLVLTGRRGASQESLEALTSMEQAGATIQVVQADVSSREDMVKVLETIQTSMPSLQGIIHAAGVLDDGILLQQDWERFTRVMAPKVKGAWHLHELTQTLSLDFFVVFSSAASLLGSPGQGNYAAANAFMDALIHYRRFWGLPGVTINWGPWGNVGMAASLNPRQQARLAAQGISTIAPEQGLQVLMQVLNSPLSQVGVLPFEWSVFTRQLGAGRHLPLFAELIDEVRSPSHPESPAQQPELLQRLQEVPAGDRESFLITYLQGRVAKVMGLPSSDLDPQESLHTMGLDSLMAVELTGMIRTELQVELPIKALIEEPSIANLTLHLMEQLFPDNSKTTEEEEVLDLNAEAVLDPAISPENASIGAVAEPTSIFLTGATGFLGAFLIQELLDQTQADVYCLVRAADIPSAAIRLQKNLEAYDLWQEHYRSRIIPILGDLAQPRLGLSVEQFETLAKQIDAIYHNGALLNYVYPYSKFKPINVLGTEEVLRLACTTKVKPVHHISSVAVFESSAYYGKRVTEFDPIDRSEGIYLGYSQSKWVSEKLVEIAGQRGLPITIHRPPLVSGHSKTGVWNTDGFLCRMIKGCIQMGSIMTDLDLMLDLSPVDYNSRAIVYLSQQPDSVGKVFHLQNPHLLHWSDLVNFICSMGYPMERVTFQEWLMRLSQSRDNPLYPLLPFFGHKWSDEQLTYIELNEQGKRPLIACEATLAALEDTSIVCPPLDSQLLGTYFSYFIHSGFLEAPTVAVGRR
jgi:malonyl CoA-acyl carrier protein transacylase